MIIRPQPDKKPKTFHQLYLRVLMCSFCHMKLALAETQLKQQSCLPNLSQRLRTSSTTKRPTKTCARSQLLKGRKHRLQICCAPRLLQSHLITMSICSCAWQAQAKSHASLLNRDLCRQFLPAALRATLLDKLTHRVEWLVIKCRAT